MKRILVTGGAGFIGSHLVDRLLEKDCSVTVVDNFDPFYPKGVKLGNVAGHRRHPRFELLELDIRDAASLRAGIKGEFDAIVHLAAKAGVRPSISAPLAYQEVNVGGTLNLLELARERSVPQFVFASSSSVYGVNPDVPWSESNRDLLPISPYASTKLGGEMLGHVYSHLYGVRFVALRFFTAYGPRQRPDLAIHKFAAAIVKGEAIPFYGDGGTRRDYTFVGDVVDGVQRAMAYQGSSYEVINLGNNHTVSLAEMVRQLELALGREAKLNRLPEQPGDVPQTWADVAKARELLGYAPKTSFAEGMSIFADWFLKRQERAVSST